MSVPGSVVVYADASPSGLASMIGTLIEQNLARDPGRSRLLKPAVFVIEAPDAQEAVTLHVGTDGIRVGEGADRAHLRVSADSARLLAIAGAPLRFGFPDLLTPQGRGVVADILRRRVRIAGLLRHPVLVGRLTMLLSAR